jgi:hypothetical protein
MCFLGSSTQVQNKTEQESHTFIEQHKVWVSAAPKHLLQHEWSVGRFSYQLCSVCSDFEANRDFEGFTQCDWEAMSSASSTSIHQIFGVTVAKESMTVGVCLAVI